MGFLRTGREDREALQIMYDMAKLRLGTASVTFRGHFCVVEPLMVTWSLSVVQSKQLILSGQTHDVREEIPAFTG
jgi:hypothetical protein